MAKHLDYLSKENGDSLKGIFAVIVVIHHLYRRVDILDGTSFTAVFQAIGYLSVAVFFFLTGYGLMVQYEKKGQVYLKDFPKKRIIPFYCNYVLLIVIYAVFRLAIFKGGRLC